MKKTVIALSGRKGSGKSSCCDFLTDNARLLFGRPVKVGRFPFAGPLKKVCVEVLGLRPEQVYGTNEEKNGLTPYYWERLPHYELLKDRRIKEAYAYAHKTTARVGLCDSSRRYHEELCAHLAAHPLPAGRMTGREVMQQVGTLFRMFDEDTWVRANLRAIESSDCDVCLIDDMRYENEAGAVKKEGGLVIRLTRCPHPGDTHESETGLDGYRGFDAVVDNAGLSVSEANCVLWDSLVGLGILEDRGYLHHDHYERIQWGGE